MKKIIFVAAFIIILAIVASQLPIQDWLSKTPSPTEVTSDSSFSIDESPTEVVTISTTTPKTFSPTKESKPSPVNAPATTTPTSPKAPTQSQEPTSVKLAVVGDFGDPSPSPAKYVAAMIDKAKVDAVVTVGDNNYPSGEMETFATNTYTYYGRFIDSQMFFPTLGNHDWGYPDSNNYSAKTLPSSKYFSYLPGNRRYYSVVLGNGLIKIVVMDTDRREPDLTSQGDWLKNELSTNETYKLVFTHEPPFSSCEGKSSDRSEFPYKQWGATLVLSGHCHLYERLEVAGLTYIVNGAGGGGQTDKFTAIRTDSLVRYNQSKGAVLITADQNSLKVSFDNILGEQIDTFSILAGSQQAK